MGFNYLQTDDRDDYLTRFVKKSKRKPQSFSLIKNSKLVLFNVASHVIRMYAKTKYLQLGQSGKKIWRKLLEDKGYTIINNY